MKTALSWNSIMGRFSQHKNTLVFHGEPVKAPDSEQENSAIDLYICNRRFSEGTISVDVQFANPARNAAADIVLYFDPQSRWTLNAGLNSFDQFTIRHFDTKWTTHSTAGAPNALVANRKYNLEAQLRGSTVTLKCDGVEVTRATLPFSLPQSQVGVFAVDRANVEFSDFKVHPVEPKAFVVMQFSSPYNEVYSEVIKSICDEEHIDVTRIDEEAGPGMIIQDITRAIREAKVVIADISPVNANVFYEVGFAHALNKPTILLAEKGTKLPFDVSPFRTLFYENSIGGKRIFEEGLRKHLRAVLQQQG
jgi:hypothetical protein